MSDSPFPSLRKEVRDFLRSSEYLVSAAATGDHPPFTLRELEMIEYYLAEVGKILEVPLGKQK